MFVVENHARRIGITDLSRQYQSIKAEVDAAIAHVFHRGDFILGEEVTQFEKEFAAYCGVKYAIGVDSGLSALELGMRALGIGKGDEVITPANSFIASSSAISFTGATPVFVDIDPTTYNMDVDQVKCKINPRTKAIMPVHLYGQPTEMDKVIKLSQEHGLWVIEDACQAHGARYKGRRVGSIGHVAAFSFYPSKNLGGYGDGGAIVTNDAKVAEKVRTMRNYGQQGKYNHVTLAWNRRLDTIQASVLRVKLRYLDEWNERRRKLASIYHQLLGDVNVVRPTSLSQCEHAYHLYVVQADDRDHLRKALAKHGIETGIHYPICIHLQPAYAYLGYKRGDFPMSEYCSDRIVSLPMFPELTEGELKYVVACIKSQVDN